MEARFAVRRPEQRLARGHVGDACHHFLRNYLF
jgi:hypothetical protein